MGFANESRNPKRRVDEEVRGETLNLYLCDGSPRLLMMWTVYPFITLVCPRILKKLPDR